MCLLQMSTVYGVCRLYYCFSCDDTTMGISLSSDSTWWLTKYFAELHNTDCIVTCLTFAYTSSIDSHSQLYWYVQYLRGSQMMISLSQYVKEWIWHHTCSGGTRAHEPGHTPNNNSRIWWDALIFLCTFPLDLSLLTDTLCQTDSVKRHQELVANQSVTLGFLVLYNRTISPSLSFSSVGSQSEQS